MLGGNSPKHGVNIALAFSSSINRTHYTFIWSESTRQSLIIKSLFCQFLFAKKRATMSEFYTRRYLFKWSCLIKNIHRDHKGGEPDKTEIILINTNSKSRKEQWSSNLGIGEYSYLSPALGRTPSPLLIFAPTSMKSSTYTRFATNQCIIMGVKCNFKRAVFT